MGCFFRQGFSSHLDPAYGHRIQGIFDGDDCEMSADDSRCCVARTDGVGIGMPYDTEQGGTVGNVDALAAGSMGQEELL